jgi:hypothetical protein
MTVHQEAPLRPGFESPINTFALHRLERTWPVEDIPAAYRINELHNLEGGDAGRRELAGYVDRHDSYLTETAKLVEAHVDDPVKGGAIMQPFSMGDRAYFASRADVPESPLDLAKLGLPHLDSKDRGTPLAVVMHGSDQKGGKASAIELILRDSHGNVSSRYLENMNAVVGTAKPENRRWVGGGQILASGYGVRAASTETMSAKQGRKESMLTLRAEPAKGSSGIEPRARMIRALPNKVEARAASPNHAPRGVRHIKKLAAAAMAGLVFTLLPIHGDDPSKNKEITTAQEMVLPGGTATDGGVRQAEQFFNDETLDRSRDAFAAYYRGDTNALQEQAKANGYESNWISPQAIAEIKQAGSISELQAAFEKAFAGAPISLSVCDTEKSLKNIFDQYNYKYTPTSNLDRSRSLALGIVDFWNIMDKRYLKNMQPLQYMVVDSIIKQASNGLDPAGYYHRAADGETTDQILLLDDNYRNDSGLIAHESGHYVDLSRTNGSGGKVSNITAWLNPVGYSYAGSHDFESSSTSYEGEHVSSSPYGNASEIESVGEGSVKVLGPKPKLSWEHSARGEKESALIFELEKEQPGFTASLLLRATTEHPSAISKSVNAMLFYGEGAQLPIRGAATLLLLSLLAGAIRARNARAIIRQYGLAPGRKFGTLAYDIDTSSFVPAESATRR